MCHVVYDCRVVCNSHNYIVDIQYGIMAVTDFLLYTLTQSMVLFYLTDIN